VLGLGRAAGAPSDAGGGGGGPAIASAAAVALPDPYLGEKICAAVVFAGTPVTLTELNNYLDQRGVAKHARPDVLTGMTALPTTAVGKVDKKAIVRQLQS
jgi:mycobactin salicyl-AMP ligase